MTNHRKVRSEVDTNFTFQLLDLIQITVEIKDKTSTKTCMSNFL